MSDPGDSAGLLDRPIGSCDLLALGKGDDAVPRLVVEVWLIVPTPEGPRVLLLERSKARGGFWQSVSGRVEADDATLRHAALREIREETGISDVSRIIDLERSVCFEGFVSGRPFRKHVLAALLPEDTTTAAVVLSEEHVQARLLPFDEAIEHLRFPENREDLAGLRALLGGASDAPGD